MKVFVFAVLMLFASAKALPTLTEDELKQQRIVTDAIASMINDISQAIIDAGLDPLEREKAEGSVSVSEPIIFSAEGIVENLHFSGLSNIALKSINFGILSQRLTMDVALPSVALQVGSASGQVAVMGTELSGEGSGRLEIIDLGINVNVRVNVGVISGITIRSLSLDLYLGGISSALNIVVLGEDYSDAVNDFLNNSLPQAFEDNRATINEFLEYIAWLVIDMIL